MPVGTRAQQTGASSSIVHYSNTNLSPSSTYQTFSGQHVADGCRFRYAFHVSTAPVHVDEVAYNPTLCQSTVVETPGLALPSRTNATGGKSGGSGSSHSGGTGVSPLSSTGLDPACSHPTDPSADQTRSYTYNWCWDTWTEDVAGITVNGVTTEVQYQPANGCANAGYSYASYAWQQFTTSGWTNTKDHWTYGFSCSNVYSNETADFENDVFCGLFPTLVYYDNQQVTGYPDGHYTIQVYYQKFGGCSGLLSFHTSTG